MMTTLSDELLLFHDQLQASVEKGEAPDIQRVLTKLDEVATQIGKSWSGSWFGYHAWVYYGNLQPPPPGAHFSPEWGLMEMQAEPGTTGDWREYDFDGVRRHIFAEAGNPNLEAAQELAKVGAKLFEEKRDEILSILETSLSRRKDPFIERLKEEANKSKVFTASDFIGYQRPSGRVMSRDSLAITQGLWTPPHFSVLAETFGLRSPRKGCEALAKIAKRAASHIERVERNARKAERVGTNVFIGHGRSLLWKDLKDFIQDRLRLPWDEFNRVPVAGITNIARLSEMLDAAAIAFLVMTAEDELVDGKMQARMNVVHEAGLFQGRLGFTRAIILLEEGCDEFTNIQGLGQIRFPKENIKAAFEEVRQVLEREGIVEG
jgi:predicted nucleotide-binding protein